MPKPKKEINYPVFQDEKGDIRCDQCKHIVQRNDNTRSKMSRSHKFKWQERFDALEKADELSTNLEDLLKQTKALENAVDQALKSKALGDAKIKEAERLRGEIEEKAQEDLKQKYTFVI